MNRNAENHVVSQLGMIRQAYNPKSNIFFAEEFYSLGFSKHFKTLHKRQYFFVFTGLNAAQQTQGVEPVRVWCWASVADCGPALNQHWVNVVLAGSVDKCLAPKRNNKFRLIHSLVSTVHKSHLITLITKAIDTTSISYQPLWLCCWRGDISSFLFTKN